MAASDARPIPRKNTAFRVTFPIWKNDGTLISSAANLDSEISGDGGAFADATNEATEVAQGVYYLDLTAGEMNYDTVAIVVKTSTASALTTTIVVYPEEAGDVRVDVVQLGGAAQSATDLKDFADAGYDPSTHKVETAKVVDSLTANADKAGYALSAAGISSVQSGLALEETLTAIKGGSWSTETLKAIYDLVGTRLAAAGYTTPPTVGDIADQVWDEAIGDHAGAGSTGAALSGATAPTAAAVADAVWDEAIADHAGAGSTGEALSGASAPTAATVADAVWDEALSGHTTAGSAGYNQGLADDIKAKTDTIGAVSVTVSSPVADDGDVETVQGDDYDVDNGRELSWTGGASWPDLTGATITVAIDRIEEYAGEVVTPTGSSKVVRLELTAAQTLAIPARAHNYSVRATLSDTHVVTLVTGKWSSIRKAVE